MRALVTTAVCKFGQQQKINNMVNTQHASVNKILMQSAWKMMHLSGWRLQQIKHSQNEMSQSANAKYSGDQLGYFCINSNRHTNSIILHCVKKVDMPSNKQSFVKANNNSSAITNSFQPNISLQKNSSHNVISFTSILLPC